jgi:transposase
VAGDKVFVDYSGKTVPIVDRLTGEIGPAQIFVAVLGASNYTYAEASWTQALPDWIGAHVHMFGFFQGSRGLVVPDNLKAGHPQAVFLRSGGEPHLRAHGSALRDRHSPSSTAQTARHRAAARLWPRLSHGFPPRDRGCRSAAAFDRPSPDNLTRRQDL